ncbi:MAG: acyl-CoA dehydrogenase C-terminal domain-containing protein [Myxococcota bacterium]
MQTYKAPVDDMMFLLDCFGYEQVVKLDAFSAYDRDTADALLRQTASFVSEVFLPINRTGDQEGLKWDPKTGAVTTPKGFKEAYAAFVENGFAGLSCPSEFGGGGAPASLGTFMSEMFTATNKSLSMCPGLTAGLVEALEHYGTDEQKQNYLGKLVTGEWAGTMCLTEPQCGTDLGLCRTKAVPEGDHYRVTGTKILITFGEHDLTENIVHLVLGRLPDAPEGIKGISTFLVPKITLSGKENNVKCTGLEHKMGIHASPTCVIDMEDSEGYLVGEPHRGMRTMFVMMNEARLLVGVEGYALAEIAYQTALEFAKDRRQSRSLDPAKQEKDQPADNILVHPDVRRMLLNVKSTNEGLRGLATYIAVNLDLSRKSEDEAAKQKADDLVALLTPVLKGFGTERGFANVSEAMQVCGGSGYTQDWSIEQYLRDVRIAMIYEGTNHIQALDLVGRKLPRHGGRMFQTFMKDVQGAIAAASEHDELKDFAATMTKAVGQLTEVTMALGAKGMADAEQAGAMASNYLSLFGLTATAFSWLRQLNHAMKTGGSVKENKLKTARYFFDQVLPDAAALVPKIMAGKEAMMAFDVEEF